MDELNEVYDLLLRQGREMLAETGKRAQEAESQAAMLRESCRIKEERITRLDGELSLALNRIDQLTDFILNNGLLLPPPL